MTRSNDMVATRRAALSGLALIAATRLARATPEERDAALAQFLAGRTPQRGRVTIDAPTLVENGNSAPITIRVDSPMTAQAHVTRIALFNAKNPQPQVAEFRLGPRNGRADVSTRMRLATTQVITAAAEFNDGTVAVDTFEVIVTIAACTEE
jgi:sulfur-oxidizing protein SoxY